MYEQKIKRYLIVLIALSTALRLIISAITELGNDEVYYWTYALFPSLSYFDHPPMVGLVVWLTTFGTSLNTEIFVRLGAVIAGSINIWLIFKIGKFLKDSKTGFYSSLLYVSSLYGSVISGTFILPDSPQVVFWLLTLHFFLRSIIKNPNEPKAKIYLYLAGTALGLAMLSKYHSAFLWIGALAYIIIYNRSWLRRKELYLSVIITIILFSPVLIWNYSTDFISFTFQSGRVGFFSEGINLNTFLQELLGQVFYNNPVNYFIIVLSLTALFGRKFDIKHEYKRLLLLTGLPIIILFLFISLSGSTFPHWSAPGYFSLILISALWLSSKNLEMLIPGPLKISLSLVMLIVIFGVLYVNYGVLNLTEDIKNGKSKLGDKDVSLEMYGWRQIGNKFNMLNDFYTGSGEMKKDAPIYTNKWYMAAHTEYYIAHGIRKEVFAKGSLMDIRNYNWLNKKRKQFIYNNNAYYVTTSHDFKDPKEVFGSEFGKISVPDTIDIYRGGEVVEVAFLYRLYANR